MVPGLMGLQLHRKQRCLQTTGHQVKPLCGCDAKTRVIFGPILHEQLVINYNRYFMHSLSISHVLSLEDTLYLHGMGLLTMSKDEYFKFLYSQEKWIFNDSCQPYATSG